MSESTNDQPTKPGVVSHLPRSLAIAERGVHTSEEFKQLMSAVQYDVLARRITPAMGNTVTAGGRLQLKVVEMEIRHGMIRSDGSRTLSLVEKTGEARAEKNGDA